MMTVLGKEIMFVKYRVVNNKMLIVLISFSLCIYTCRYIYIYADTPLLGWNDTSVIHQK